MGRCLRFSKTSFPVTFSCSSLAGGAGGVLAGRLPHHLQCRFLRVAPARIFLRYAFVDVHLDDIDYHGVFVLGRLISMCLGKGTLLYAFHSLYRASVRMLPVLSKINCRARSV